MKHTIMTSSGDRFHWDDDDPKPWSDERTLLDAYEQVERFHRLTTYVGKDPYEEHNTLVDKAADSILALILDIRKLEDSGR